MTLVVREGCFGRLHIDFGRFITRIGRLHMVFSRLETHFGLLYIDFSRFRWRFGRLANNRCTTILPIIESRAIIIGRCLFIHKGVVDMPVYNKLVRDRIPEIIEMSGKVFTTRILEEDDYLIEINKKMHEELAEYEEATSNEDSVEELADLLELIYAAANTYGTTIEELEKIRIHKAKIRGGFEERIFLVDVEDD